jgi:PAS domain S-box-containing protein
MVKVKQMEAFQKIYRRIPTSIRITYIYALLGSLWILASDRLVAWLVSDPEKLTQIQTIKGWFYILASALLIFFLVSRSMAAVEHWRATQMRVIQNIILIGREILAAHSTKDVAQTALCWLRQELQCPRASLLLFDFQTYSALEYHVEAPEGSNLLDPIAVQIDSRWIDRLRNSEHILIPNILAEDDVPPIAPALKDKGMQSLLAMPLYGDGTLIGGLLLASDRIQAFTHEQQEIAHEVAAQLAIAIHQSQLREQVERHAAELEERVTERTAQLSASEALYRTLFESAPQVIWMADANGKITDANRIWYESTGATPEETLGDNWVNYLHREDCDRVIANWQHSIQAGEFYHDEARFRANDGQYLHSILVGAPVRDANGEILRWVGINTDVTSLKRTEYALQIANRELETFTYSVSHDLKAPLRGIDGYSRLLLEDYPDRLDEDGRIFLNSIRHATDQMSHLIDDLLEYSRLEQRKLLWNEVDLPGLVQELLFERNDEIKRRRAEVVLSLECKTLRAEPEGIAQILRNLLDNALKFTQNRPAPLIEIGSRQSDGVCLIWVKDNGIGFNPQYHDRIFEIFQRLHRAEEYPGTGIGLAIVHKAVQRMNGRVWAESQPGLGATFYVEFVQ